jgi:hypothetical protein
MKLLKRLCILLFLLIANENLSAQRDPGDTLLIHRPKYFGIFFGRIQFAGAPHPIYDEVPQAYLGKQAIKVTVTDALHTGLFFTFPFLHRMEWDAGVGVFSFQRKTIWADVTRITPGYNPQVLDYHTWSDPKPITVMEFRSYFSCELIRTENYAVLAGGGGWLATQRMPSSLNPGSAGFEANFTGYYRFHKKSFVQIHLSPGWMKNGYYINFGLGICYEGQRLMRAHPKHYYVRTYDPEE